MNLTNYQYYNIIQLNNTQNTSTLTNYQVQISLTSSNFNFTLAQSTGADIVFTDSDGSTLLNFWIESWSSSGSTATIWVQVPSIPASSNHSIYMYYGNASATSLSNGTNTFNLFDDFPGTALNTNLWALNVSGGSYSVANSHLALQTSIHFNKAYFIRSVQNFTYPMWIEFNSISNTSEIRLIGESTSTSLNGSSYCYPSYGVLSVPNTTNIFLISSSSGSVTDLQSETLTAENGTFSFSWTQTGQQIFNLDYINQITTNDTTNTIGNYYVYLGLPASGVSQTLIINWARVRQYTPIEPTFTINSTQENVTNNFIFMGISF